MQILINIPELGAVATRAEIIDTHTDVPQMRMTICVGLFNDADDRLKFFTVEHQLTGFPIPSNEEQWGIVMPIIEKMQETQ